MDRNYANRSSDVLTVESGAPNWILCDLAKRSYAKLFEELQIPDAGQDRIEFVSFFYRWSASDRQFEHLDTECSLRRPRKTFSSWEADRRRPQTTSAETAAEAEAAATNSLLAKKKNR